MRIPRSFSREIVAQIIVSALEIRMFKTGWSSCLIPRRMIWTILCGIRNQTLDCLKRVYWGFLGHSNDWSGCQMGCPTIARLAFWNFPKGTNPKSSSGLLPSSFSSSSSSSSSSAAASSSKKISKNRCHSSSPSLQVHLLPISFGGVSFQKKNPKNIIIIIPPACCEIITSYTWNPSHPPLLQVVRSCLRCFARKLWSKATALDAPVACLTMACEDNRKLMTPPSWFMRDVVMISGMLRFCNSEGDPGCGITMIWITNPWFILSASHSA